MSYKKCLEKRNYTLTTDIYKQTANNVVLDVKLGGIRYVCKILIHNKNINKLELLNMKTEIQALKYLNQMKFQFVPMYIDNFKCRNVEIVIMEKLKGKLLIELKDRNLSSSFWRCLVYQLILIVYILESMHILHNDFWDSNIMLEQHSGNYKIVHQDKIYNIPNCKFIVKIFDFQYMNHYHASNSPQKIKSPFVLSNDPSVQSEKIRLGWSETFHVGGDLNQIFGLLSGYKSIPAKLKKFIDQNVVRNVGTDFPYAINKDNVNMEAKRLLNIFDHII